MSHAQQPTSESADPLFNVKKFGAIGDGLADDTAAIQRAIDAAGQVSGGVFFPPGVYLSSTLQMRSHVALVATATWSYHRNGSAVIRLRDDHADCLIDLRGTIGARLSGIALDGCELGQSIVGVFLDGAGHKEEETLVLENTRVAHFTGDAVSLLNVWGFTVRHCMFIFNGGNGLTVTRWDGFIYHNIINNCKGYGIALMSPNASITMVGNRVEWNGKGNLFIERGGNYQINDNYFDRAGGPGVHIAGGDGEGERIGTITMTGNLFYRNGAKSEAGTHASCHVLLKNADGVVMTGNTFRIGGNDSGAGTIAPSFGIILGGLKNSIIKDNVLNNGATQSLVLDLGGHDANSIIKDNIGSLASKAWA
jgi:hypothetical protein